VMFLLWLANIYFFVRGYWFSIFTAPVAFWVFGVNTFHDGSHFAVSRRWWLNAFCCYIHPFFSSPLAWYYQHVIGHHPYVNIKGKDPDLYHHSPLHRYMPFHRFKPLHVYQALTIIIVWIYGVFFMSFVVDLVMLKKGVYQHVVPIVPLSSRRKILHILGRLGTMFLCHGAPFLFLPLAKALIWATIPWAIFSVLFLTISQVGHITESTIEPPTDRDFYKHQILHTHNYGVNSLLCFYMSGGLNLQIEHHLFPGVNHVHLRKLAPLVRELCKKYNIAYAESSGFFDALWKHYSLLRWMSSPKTAVPSAPSARPVLLAK